MLSSSLGPLCIQAATESVTVNLPLQVPAAFAISTNLLWAKIRHAHTDSADSIIGSQEHSPLQDCCKATRQVCTWVQINVTLQGQKGNDDIFAEVLAENGAQRCRST